MKRENFGSRIGFILVSAGCAVGLGNVWKFPYMCGQYGGAAFIIIYLLFLAILGFPIMVCEFAVGRASRKSVASSFKELQPLNTRWDKFSYLGIAGNYLLMMFYTCVAGWMMYYCFRYITGDFSSPDINPEQIKNAYDTMLQQPKTMLLWMILVIFISFGICSLGVQKGIEKITKIMMSCLLILIFVLAFHSVSLEGAKEGVSFYLKPDFQKIKDIGLGNVIFGAMSQSFFTLSVGMGSMAIFGSYMKKDRTLTGETLNIMVLDTFVALMAGLIVIPACFAFGIKPDAGPELVFITLPNVFTKMPAGQIWGACFFLFLTFAALSTVIAVFENIVSFGIDLFGLTRKKAVLVNIFLVTLLSIPCVLGFNLWSGFSLLGNGKNIMDLEDFLVSNNILPLGSLVYLRFCTSKYGWGFDNFIKEADCGVGTKFPAILKSYMSYLLPCIIIVIYLKGYYDLFSSKNTISFIGWMTFAIALLLLTVWFCTPHKKQKSKSGRR